MLFERSGRLCLPPLKNTYMHGLLANTEREWKSYNNPRGWILISYLTTLRAPTTHQSSLHITTAAVLYTLSLCFLATPPTAFFPINTGTMLSLAIFSSTSIIQLGYVLLSLFHIQRSNKFLLVYLGSNWAGTTAGSMLCWTGYIKAYASGSGMSSMSDVFTY